MGRRKTYTWTGQDIPRVKSERFAADSNGVWQSITWALPMTWQKIGAWYAGHARGRYDATPALDARIAALLSGGAIKTVDDTLRAIHMSVRLTGGHAITSAGRSAMLPLPIANMANLGGLIRELENADPRRFPISAQAIFGYGETLTQLELTLPEGWEAQLPDNVELDTDFGRYRKVYRQDGRVLKVERFVGGGTKVVAPERVGELIEFFKALMKDDATVLVIER